MFYRVAEKQKKVFTATGEPHAGLLMMLPLKRSKPTSALTAVNHFFCAVIIEAWPPRTLCTVLDWTSHDRWAEIQQIT